MEKITLPIEIKNEIIEKYKNGMSIRKIERLYDNTYSFTFLHTLLKSIDFEEKISKQYPQKEGYLLFAVCKKTNKEFIDYSNVSGSITKHVVNVLNINIPSKFKRKSLEFSSNKYWYDEYFHFIYKEKNKIKKCSYCDWYTDDINNRSGAYKKHLKNIHNLTVEDHVKEFVLDADYFNIKNTENDVVCLICNKKFKILTHKHLQTHNISVYNYKLNYSEETVSCDYHNKLSKLRKRLNLNSVKSKTSKPENEIKDFLVSNGIDIIQSSRKYLNGVEIDLFSKEHMIGIEYNGNLYHSEIYGKKDRNYHINKTKIAFSNNIKLYHIHEDEWEYSKDLVKSKLLHLFKLNNNEKIYARNCIIQKITKSEKSSFLNNNHIQGDDKSIINLGAYYNGMLCAVMTFNNNRKMNKVKNNNNEFYDLSRFATLINYNVVGVGGKLLSFFIKNYNPKRIISFADRKWTPDYRNNLYTSLGFKCVNIGYPDYSYYKKSEHRGRRLHKFGYGKGSLKKRYPNIFNNEKTEWEMMQELGYDRIWDCGKLKYELIIK